MIKENDIVKVVDWAGMKKSVLTEQRLDDIIRVFENDLEAKITKFYFNGSATATNSHGSCDLAAREMVFLKKVVSNLHDNVRSTYTLAEYINKFFSGSQREFARAQGVKPTQVTQWLNKNIIVVNDEMYSHRRTLKR